MKTHDKEGGAVRVIAPTELVAEYDHLGGFRFSARSIQALRLALAERDRYIAWRASAPLSVVMSLQ